MVKGKKNNNNKRKKPESGGGGSNHNSISLSGILNETNSVLFNNVIGQSMASQQQQFASTPVKSLPSSQVYASTTPGVMCWNLHAYIKPGADQAFYFNSNKSPAIFILKHPHSILI